MTTAAMPVPAGPVDLNVAPPVPAGPDLPRYAWRPVAAVAIVVAGAIDRYGPADGLPTTVYSGQNQLYFYGPPPADDIAVIVGADPDSRLASLLASCETADTLDNRLDVDNEEQGRLILVCREPTGPWSALWPSFQHYS